ncbi:uncharacterized protein F4822DRAFT_433003 [Hypoxylon trugodes]|uniref:uncharacterized protein n=1 Tax=Hypoxylon trugodes TaxID=326681 RepID=UPI00219D47FF|nr:uncharacterized protein F4822DRAFT_433003 [Hypoxylon trugodes]KAI1384456.1 hypothetical protein F4822DRAFT_433003 [Hypoxylon trugodes]
MADQCIVCLENLDVQSSSPLAQLHTSPDDDPLEGTSSTITKAPARLSPTPPESPLCNITNISNNDGEDHNIAVIEVCGHALHDACLREWTGKANSCPICRQAFHLVHVYDKLGGTQLSSYKVEDKKQVVEFDPQAWLDDNPEIEESRPCPICHRTDDEDVLLLCDSCDAPYHTHCVGLDSVPRGHWFCFECADTGSELLTAELQGDDFSVAGFSDGHSDYLPRTSASMRRARQQARSSDWQGAWGQIAGRVYDALNLDLDNHDDDEVLRGFRRTQQRSEQERNEYRRWQQRISIASRLGAHDVFANNLSNVLPPSVAPRASTPRPSPFAPPEESQEERQAWGALEKAMEATNTTNGASSTPNHRKRKSRSVTASPVEPQQPERKLKRPRTRRAPMTGHASSSSSRHSIQTNQPTSAGSGPSSASTQPSSGDAPSFLSSLLKEVEMSTPSDDENTRPFFTFSNPIVDQSSPASSPSPSAHSSPRAMSATPPPRGIMDRPGSPLSLSSHIEPIYPPTNYMANRNNSDNSDSESGSRQHARRNQNGRAHSGSPGIQQPRPQRQQSANINRSEKRPQETSPARVPLPFEMKESISGIVKDALKPHWKSGHITADQYASINRDLSHKLYKEVSDDSLNDNARQRFEKIATKEVARAVATLKA